MGGDVRTTGQSHLYAQLSAETGWLHGLSEKWLFSDAPIQVALFPISSYVSIPSHPLGASTSTRTYLLNISLGYFLHVIQFQGHSNDLLAGKRCAGEWCHLLATGSYYPHSQCGGR